MDNNIIMNSSYGNIAYSGQLGDITELQIGQKQSSLSEESNYHTEQLHIEEATNLFDELKENNIQGRENISTSNQVSNGGNSEKMDQTDEVKKVDSESEAVKENHHSDDASNPEEAVKEAKENDKTESLENETVEEKVDGVKDEQEEKKDEVVDDKDGVDTAEDVKNDSKLEEEGEKVKTRRRDGQPADLEICRVCMSKENLSSIFEFETAFRRCDLIMKVCSTVSIRERDHLPHKVCSGCVEKAKIAYDFKILCENTDKELRQTLKRSYNKTRRTTDFVIVNCPMSDEEENDEEPQDDDEYKVSQSEVESEPVTSDDSFEPPNKRKKTPKRRGRRPKNLTPSDSTPADPPVKRKRGRQPGTKYPRKPVTEGTPTTTPRRGRPPGRPPGRPRIDKTPGIANVVYIEAPDPSTSDSDDDKPIRPRKTHDCTKCDETFQTGVELKEHLITHKGDLFPCTKCDKSFKSKVYLSNHLERHDQDDKRREEKIKAKELKKQAQKQKEQQKRKEQEDRIRQKVQSASSSSEKKKKVEPSPASSGRDLFKCVAPLTSTYWSDSFSD